jgi:hypothetical protein
MLVCFHAEITQGEPVVLRIERVAVIDLYAVTLAKEEAIVGKYAAAVSGVLLHAVLGRVLDPASESLYANLLPAGLLRHRGQCGQAHSQEDFGESVRSHHFLVNSLFVEVVYFV